MTRATKIVTVETIQFSDANLRMSNDGYVTASPRVARTGIQMYKGSELGMPQMDQVAVWRPEAEVFKTDAMHSFGHKPITDDHPPEQVTAKNWKQYSVGQSGDEVVRDGEFIRVPMVLMDAAIIDKVNAGKSELSVGYSAALVWGDGVNPAGEKYNAIQTDIRANHIAIVDTARGGPKLKIGDASASSSVVLIVDQQKEDQAMTTANTKTILVDGISVTVPEMEANIVQRHIAALTDSVTNVRKELADAKDALAKAQTDSAVAATEAKKATDVKDAEIATLKKQVEDSALTPEKLDQLVKDRGEVIAKAQHVMDGATFDVAGKSVSDIMQAVVVAKIGDSAKAWNADQVKASFATLTAGVDLTKVIVDGATQLAQGIQFTQQHGNGNTQAMLDKAYDDRDSELQNAWKGPQHKVA